MEQRIVSARDAASLRRFSALLMAGTALAMTATPASAQSAGEPDAEEDVIVVSGIRGSLQLETRLSKVGLPIFQPRSSRSAGLYHPILC